MKPILDPILDKIREPVADQIVRYEKYLEQSLYANDEITRTMLNYILDSRGKAIRPMLVLLTALMYKPESELPEDTLLCAMLVEMVHTASLVHDDVIDEAFIRRGIPSAKAMWRSRRAVLIGDYILAKSFIVGMNSGAYELVRYISLTMTDLCEGELLQSDQSDRLTMTREIYDDIIFRKTASLICASSGSGALSVNAPKDQVEAIQEYGRNLGVAFQIRDDMLDYMLTAKTGKPVCGDLRERKITLPLLTVLEQSSQTQHDKIIALLSDVRNTPANVEKLCEIVTNEGGLEMATKELETYVASARKALQRCPDSIYRTALDSLCTYVAEREV